MPPPCAYVRSDNGLIVSIRATPNARHDRIDGRYETADGSVSLRIRVTAQAEKGRANKAVLSALAAALGQGKSTVNVIAGHKERNKKVAIDGNFDELAARIDELLEA